MEPAPTSLLAALNCASATHLIVGSNPLAATRCAQSVAAGAHPLVVAPPSADVHYGLQKHFDSGAAKWIQRDFRDEDLFTLGREEVSRVVDAVFVTVGPRSPLSSHIASLCRRNRIPVNVVDAPDLCTFTLLSTHTDGPLQVGVTTNGHGCKLASRIRREVSAALPPGLGAACARLGRLRRRIAAQDRVAAAEGEEEESVGQGPAFNRLVREGDADGARERRARWLGQVCEYWPLGKLAAVTDEDIEAVLSSPVPTPSPPPASAERVPLAPAPAPAPATDKPGTLVLAGSGPGHPDLLTRATHRAIQAADLVLADKLVPSQVLDLIPRRTPLHIARKFPGNAEAAQAELLERALSGVREGKLVVRLKQGDPFIYGRGGEEVAFFRERGLGARVAVLPGVTSALSAPLFAGVPCTQRDVADQVLMCTGTGKKGVAPAPPEFVASRTVVFLMALHRISGLVAELTGPLEREEGKRALWPADTPCAVVERASCPDQRVIRTTLGHVVEAIEQEGSRPPGLLVVGRACEALCGGEGRAWIVEEGFRGLEFGDE